jgi:hypothetical protein
MKTQFEKNRIWLAVMKMMVVILTVFIILLIAASCSTPRPGVSYTPIFKEQKGLKHTFILEKSTFVWVLNYQKHCLPMQPEINLTFSEEVPFKRFKTHKYQVSETRGYNCDGDFAVVMDDTSTLAGLLRTMKLKTISINALNAPRVTISVDGERIFKAVNALNWKTPVMDRDAETV